MATVVTRTQISVTLYVLCLSCFFFLSIEAFILLASCQ